MAVAIQLIWTVLPINRVQVYWIPFFSFCDESGSFFESEHPHEGIE